MKNIVIVSHKFLTQPDDDLVLYLTENNFENVLHIRHSFSDALDRCSFFSWYKNGKLYCEYRTKDYKNIPEILIYLKEFYFTFKWVWESKLVWNKYIGMDGLCVFFGNALRILRRVDKVIYWAIDFVPKDRFKSWIKNVIYRFVNSKSCKKADEMWDLSPRMADARENSLEIRKSDYKIYRIVPYGVWTNRIKKYSYHKCEKNTLVFLGHILEKQGIQLVIKAIPKIVERIPNFKFKIIGDGVYKNKLIKLSNDLAVSKYCDFKGLISNIKEVENEVAKSCLAIAPYVRELDSWTYFADPGKVKTYLACGIPVLLTEIPWNAREIEGMRCGKIIKENEEDISLGILELMDGIINQKFRNNAIKYSKNFDYEKIFGDLNL